MGTVYATVKIGNLNGGDMYETEALVDTGATDSAFPATLLERLHIAPQGDAVTYVTADGTEVKCQRGQAMLSVTVDGATVVSGICPVSFRPDDSGQCIGTTTLQVLMLGVDPPNGRLVRVSTGRRGWAGPIPMAHDK